MFLHSIPGMRIGEAEQNLRFAVFGDLGFEHDTATGQHLTRHIRKDRCGVFVRAKPAQGQAAVGMVGQGKPGHYATFAARNSSAS